MSLVNHVTIIIITYDVLYVYFRTASDNKLLIL